MSRYNENTFDELSYDAGNRYIVYTCQFSYLGAFLDEELTLKPFYNNIKKQIVHKLVALGKTTYSIKKDSA